MEIKKGEADLRAGSNATSAASNDVLELELYDDLVAFSALHPEEQRLLADQPGPRAGADPVAGLAGEISYPELFRVEESFFEPAGEPLPVASNDSVVEMFDLTLFNMNATAQPLDDISPEPNPTSQVENSSPRVSNSGGLRITGSLSNTSPLEDIWSGATIKTAILASCSTCGLQSEAGDLFCIECGEFLDSGDMAKVAAVCVECDSIIGNDDIFCPSCGSMISAD